MRLDDAITVSPIRSAYPKNFDHWGQISWIRSKPVRDDSLLGLPFPIELVPISQHPLVARDSLRQTTALAYHLLSHLKFTTVLELDNVNPVCSALVQGKSPIELNERQRSDALKIYCDEGGHALFVELLFEKVRSHFGLDTGVLLRPAFDRQLEALQSIHASTIAPGMLRLFFVAISETIISRILRDIPRDERVAPVVRKVISDHAADEALHSSYFRWYFIRLWQSLSRRTQELVGPLLPQLLWIFLMPHQEQNCSILRALGFTAAEAATVLAEAYDEADVRAAVREAAAPTLRMFEEAGVLVNPSLRQHFFDTHLLL